MAEERPVIALRTPLYLIMALFGIAMVIATFLPWATVDSAGSDVSVSGTDAGGWGAAAIVIGFAIAVISVIGYFWNPFSDPEALFVAGFALAAFVGTAAKMADVASFVDPGNEFAPDATAGIGLPVILLAAAAAMAAGGWIAFSRPRAEARIGGDGLIGDDPPA